MFVGIAVAGVEHVGGGRAHLLLAIRDLERGSLVDRRGERAILLVKVGAAADRFRFRVVLVFFHHSPDSSIAPAKAAIERRNRRQPRGGARMAPAGEFVEFSLQGACDWAGFTVADGAEVDLPQADDFGSGAADEDFIGDIKLVARNRLFDHRWPRSRASVIRLSRVMPSRMAPRAGV